MDKRKLTYSELFRKYLHDEVKLELYQKVGVLLLVVVFAGVFGWILEFCVKETQGHFEYIYIEGGNLLPWVNIYAYGALLITVTTYKLRRYPWAVFLVAALGCGLLELLAGWLVFTIGNGTRYWDYSGDWWGVGSINGFVCPVSACAFGIGALALMYLMLPFCIYLATRMSKRAFLTLAITLFTVVMVDDLVNLILKNTGSPTAMDLYESWGWRYK